MEKYPTIQILLNLPQKYIPKAEFVLRTYCSILRLHPQFDYGRRREGVHLYYGSQTAQEYPIKIYFNEETAEFFDRLELYPLNKVNFYSYRNEYIPFLFSQSGPIFSFGPQNVIFRKDIIASGFYFLSCWHEYILSLRGESNPRVDFRQSLQYRWDFIDIPVIDVYCQMLWYAMGISLPQFIREIDWDGDKRFSISISHDIDYWNYWIGKQKIDNLLYNLRTWYKRPINATYKIIGHTFHKNLIHNPRRQLHWIKSKEEKLGVKSTWFLFGKDDFDDERRNYIGNPEIQDTLLELLQDQEVGLHGSPEAAFDVNVLLSELHRLQNAGFEVKGYRSHYLYFDYQKSFKILEQAGIQYDSTLGYWESIGFRAGISFPFYPFNIEENRPFHILEIPLIVMDTTLYSNKAMNLTPATALRKLKRMVKNAERYQSHLSLLWHNVNFDPIDFPFWGNVYWAILRYARKKNGWITTLNDIYNEWITLS